MAKSDSLYPGNESGMNTGGEKAEVLEEDIDVVEDDLT